MTTDERPAAPSQDCTHETRNPSTDPTVGTETALKGPDAAKRQAERDWQNSAKEEGE